MKKRRKKSKLKKAKEEAWKAFSEYIRKLYADKNGYVKCVTCSTIKHWKEMQAGHFIDGRNNAVLLNEDIVHPQCYRCNINLRGNKVAYSIYMLERGYTKDDLERFHSLKIVTTKCSVARFEELTKKYKKLTRKDI